MAALLRRSPTKVVQLEFTQFGQYAESCAGAKTILVEHDVTLDLYRQLVTTATGGAKWELERQLALWETFERAAWKKCDRVIAMSQQDRAVIGNNAVAIPNGVDTQRFQPFGQPPEPGRLLFIGSFAHLPNLIAVDFFMREVQPALRRSKLHIIAGSRPEYYLDFYKERVQVDVTQPTVELEGFVSDVRPAYSRAQIVIAPLLVSAGTNIKILEAMAMGKAIVSTPAGVNALDVNPGRDVIVVKNAAEMAAAIQELMSDPARCAELGREARRTVSEHYDWDRIAERQRDLYQSLLAEIA